MLVEVAEPKSWNQFNGKGRGVTGPSLNACVKEANAPHRVGLLKYLNKTTCLSKGLQDELSSGQEEEEQKREWWKTAMQLINMRRPCTSSNCTALSSKLQTFFPPQVECFFQALSLLHIWVQFSACPLWKSIPPPLLCPFPPALWTNQGEGITLSLPSSKQDNKWFLSTDTPLPSRRKRQRKPSKLPGYGCAFWALSANRGNSFYTWSLSYLREPWENACTAPEGGKKGGERGSWCFSTSASNQSPEITATVYGLWSKLLFRTTREKAVEGERGGGGKGWEPRPRGCGGQGREIRGYGTFWSLKACLDLIQWVLRAEQQVAWNIQDYFIFQKSYSSRRAVSVKGQEGAAGTVMLHSDKCLHWTNLQAKTDLLCLHRSNQTCGSISVFFLLPRPSKC